MAVACDVEQHIRMGYTNIWPAALLKIKQTYQPWHVMRNEIWVVQDVRRLGSENIEGMKLAKE